MQLVLDFGVEHPSYNEVVPPSPNSSSDSVQRQAAIAQAHRDFQLGPQAVLGPVKSEEEPPPVFPGFGPSSSDSIAVNVPAAPAPEAVDPVGEQVQAGLVDEPVPTGPVTDESSTNSSSLSSVLPANDPGPDTIAGGQCPVDAFIEFGTVNYPPDAHTWFRFSSAPTQFKLVAGADGREFLFCMPNADEVDVTHVDRAGYRDVCFQVRPSTKVFGGQTDPVTPPPSSPGTPDGTPPASESDSVGQEADAASDAGSPPVSSVGTNTSDNLDKEITQEVLAAAELTK